MPDREPPLYERHEAAGAEFTGFGGWEMPVTYETITAEHAAVREEAGVFDVSHMGEITVEGPDATALMAEATTAPIRELTPGGAQYACVLTAEGVLVDDTVVYDRPDTEGYLFVPNAGNDEAMTARWKRLRDDRGFDATVTNRTAEFGMLAVQGPAAPAAVDAVTADPVTDLARFSARATSIDGVSCLVARTGYTGEDGFEVVFEADDSVPVWEAFEHLQPCGLGARDTLRLEAGLLLSGQDFHPDREPRTPQEAKLDFAVDRSKPTFVGKDALERRKEERTQELIGIEMDGRGIPRHGYPIVHDGDRIGHVTSGTMSPTFGVAIGLGYVESAFAEEGTSVGVEIRDRTVGATVVPHRFLRHRRN